MLKTAGGNVGSECESTDAEKRPLRRLVAGRIGDSKLLSIAT